VPSTGTTFAGCSLALVARFSLAIPHPPTRVSTAAQVYSYYASHGRHAFSQARETLARPLAPRFARVASRAVSPRAKLARVSPCSARDSPTPATTDFRLPAPFGQLRGGSPPTWLYAPLRSDWPPSPSLSSTTLGSCPSRSGSAFGWPRLRGPLAIAGSALSRRVRVVVPRVQHSSLSPALLLTRRANASFCPVYQALHRRSPHILPLTSHRPAVSFQHTIYGH
jgi:hypothetical protein